MRLIVGLFRAVWELLVDDGQLAIGVIASLGLTAVWTLIVPAAMRDLGGPILFILLMALLLANLQRAARNARRRAS